MGSDSFYLYNLYSSTNYSNDELHINSFRFILIIGLDSMEVILQVELLGLLYKSTYNFNVNTYICNACLSLFNIILIIIEKKERKKKCEEHKLHNVRTISYYEKHGHLIEKKRGWIIRLTWLAWQNERKRESERAQRK
jgi:hypothetical protein